MRQVIVGHTAGPWRVAQTVSFPRLLVRAPQGDKAIADCDFGQNEEEAQANARLIASAPELLEALQGAVNVINAWAELTPATRQLVADARAAIAKAEGKV